MRYRVEIDGLRALAVIPIIFFHAGFDVFSGGFIGVDVFFVISGYLITSIILAKKEAGTFSLADFYERRARRILPVLFLVMVVSIPFAWFLLLPGDMKDFSESLAAVAIFSSNIFFWRESGYFATAAELKPLLHTWSLAVEEQYYALFPIFILLTWKLGKRYVVIIFAVIALFSLGVAEWGSINKPAAAFYLLPTRGWELLIGVFAAFYLFEKIEPKGNNFLSLIGLLLVLLSIFIFDKETPFPGVFALVPTLGTVLIILFAYEKTIVNRLLSNKLIAGLGLISYSAYLWHQPILAFARIRFNDLLNFWIMMTLISISLALAFLSWKFVELPFRKRSLSIVSSSKFIIISFILFTIFFIIIGVLGSKTDGFKDFYINNRLSQSDVKILGLVNKHTRYNMYDFMVDDGLCKFWGRSVSEQLSTRFVSCIRKHKKAIIVLGDSHAMNLYNIVAKSDVYPFVVGISQGGCRPHDNYKTCHYDDFDNFIEKNSTYVEKIFYHQSGSYLINDKNGFVDSSLAFNDNSSYKFSDRNITGIIMYLKKISKLSDIVWVGPFVEARINFNDVNTIVNKLSINNNSIRIFGELEKHIQSRMKSGLESQEFSYFSLYDELAIKKDFIKTGSCITYRDTDHFSRCGENIISSALKKSLSRLIVSDR